MTQLSELTIQGFNEELAKKTPTPGGGSVAALNASLAASLFAMVAALTTGKKKYQDVEEEMQEIGKKNNRWKDEFVQAINEDASSFDGVVEAFAMPKETEEEKKARSAKIQEGYRAAISVPMSLALKTLEVYPSAVTLAQKGNASALSDVSVGAMNLRVAFFSALENVKINLKSVKDEAYVKEMEEKMAKAIKEVEEKDKEIQLALQSR